MGIITMVQVAFKCAEEASQLNLNLEAGRGPEAARDALGSVKRQT